MHWTLYTQALLPVHYTTVLPVAVTGCPLLGNLGLMPQADTAWWGHTSSTAGAQCCIDYNDGKHKADKSQSLTKQSTPVMIRNYAQFGDSKVVGLLLHFVIK